MTNPFNLTSAGLYNTIGKTSEAEQQQGLSNFNSLLSSLTNNLTVNPSVQANINSANAGIAGQNALNSAMPDPAAAAAQQQKLFDDYLAKISGSGGGFNISGAAPSFTPMPTSTSTGRSSFGGAMVGPSGNPYTNPYSVQTIGGNWGGGGTGMYDPSQSYGSQNVTVSGGAQQSPIASAPVGGDGIDYELMNAYGMSPWEWADMSGGLTY